VTTPSHDERMRELRDVLDEYTAFHADPDVLRALSRAIAYADELRAEILELQDLVTAAEERANELACKLESEREARRMAEAALEAARARADNAEPTFEALHSLTDQGVSLPSELAEAFAAWIKAEGDRVMSGWLKLRGAAADAERCTSTHPRCDWMRCALPTGHEGSHTVAPGLTDEPAKEAPSGETKESLLHDWQPSIPHMKHCSACGLARTGHSDDKPCPVRSGRVPAKEGERG